MRWGAFALYFSASVAHAQPFEVEYVLNGQRQVSSLANSEEVAKFQAQMESWQTKSMISSWKVRTVSEPVQQEDSSKSALVRSRWLVPMGAALTNRFTSKEASSVDEVLEFGRELANQKGSVTSALVTEPVVQSIQVDPRWKNAIEYHDMSGSGRVEDGVRLVMKLTDRLGKDASLENEKLLSELSGMHPAAIEELRQNGKTSGIRVIRHHLAAEPYAEPKNGFQKVKDRILQRLFHGPIEMYEIPEQGGVIPVEATGGEKGETVVWHRRHMHRKTMLGKYNPALINFDIQDAMENKLFEAKLIEKYLPGAMAKSSSLEEVLQAEGKPVPHYSHDSALADKIRKMKKSLDQAFPNGWVLKGAYDSNTGTEIISDKDDLEKILKYLDTDFDAVHQEIKARLPGEDWEYVLYEMKKRPDFKTYRLLEYLKSPELTLVQERLKLMGEYRVEMIEGKLLSKRAVTRRYMDGLPKLESTKIVVQGLLGIDPKANMVMENVEQWFAKLPEAYRNIPYGLDVAIVEQNGKTAAKIIELNSGGNSGLLWISPLESRALNKYLRKYPERAKKGEAYLGLSGDEQMKLIKKEIQEFGLNPQRHFPGMVFTKTEFLDRNCILPGLHQYLVPLKK
ncbi:MAG: hypothetical protein A2X94_16275 [Bdellovibrionales bacterium GWB1_55_8]|nr:MAG: hypothetical protein A2X94_16275 [Bdellovibrionales bacterium GWB1_55_8]